MKVEPWRLVAGDTEGPVAFAFPQGQVVAWARRAPHRAGGNQDGCAVVPLGGDDGVLLVLADGAGGLPAAERAAEVVIDALDAMTRRRPGDRRLLDEVDP